MAYADKSAMEQRFKDLDLVELTNADDPHAEVINDAVLQTALDDASTEIDLHVGSIYVLPLTVAQPALIPVCCDIARFKLHAGKATEEVKDRYNNAVKLLEKIAKDEIMLSAKRLQSASGPVFQAAPLKFNSGELFK
ncbi:phage protein Gp36 family protein [Terasakiella sp. A23]|uniref:gp436 family protein n=1 Tax=Terasakiella sp. FCG-A23 TaxID=3080561 RepID=UPI0029544821|nr:phage protein Gp36 family protein [Terasakiella sp. A23]MDV7340976.1 phage protein Gp36 family protein [Terasakiella sp. A23]